MGRAAGRGGPGSGRRETDRQSRPSVAPSLPSLRIEQISFSTFSSLGDDWRAAVHYLAREELPAASRGPENEPPRGVSGRVTLARPRPSSAGGRQSAVRAAKSASRHGKQRTPPAPLTFPLRLFRGGGHSSASPSSGRPCILEGPLPTRTSLLSPLISPIPPALSNHQPPFSPHHREKSGAICTRSRLKVCVCLQAERRSCRQRRSFGPGWSGDRAFTSSSLRLTSRNLFCCFIVDCVLFCCDSVKRLCECWAMGGGAWIGG